MEAFAVALVAYVLGECSGVVLDVAPGDPRPSSRETHARLTPDAVDRVAQGAARYVLERWSADYIAEQQRRGRVGGSRSRRGPTWTAEDLDALAKLDGLTVSQVCERTGWARRRVERMRAALRADS